MTCPSKSEYQKLRDFHYAFDYPMSNTPTPMSRDMVLNRMGFLTEEVIELLHATALRGEEFHQMYTELLDRMDKSFLKQSEKEHPINQDEKLIAQIDAEIDIKYFNNGDFTILGVDPSIPFDIVHSCNMQKLWGDGKPRYNEHGKIVKPEGWQPPENQIEQEIQRQIQASLECHNQ